MSICIMSTEPAAAYTSRRLFRRTHRLWRDPGDDDDDDDDDNDDDDDEYDEDNVDDDEDQDDVDDDDCHESHVGGKHVDEGRCFPDRHQSLASSATMNTTTKTNVTKTSSLLLARAVPSTSLLPHLSFPSPPPPRSLFDTVCSSLVVGQELALAVLLLAHHRCLVEELTGTSAKAAAAAAAAAGGEEDDEEEKEGESWESASSLQRDRVRASALSLWIVAGTLFFVALCGKRAAAAAAAAAAEAAEASPLPIEKGDENAVVNDGGGGDREPRKLHRPRWQQRQQRRRRRRRKVDLAVRTLDASLFAAILRLLSSVLRTLTASYSSDTVAALSAGMMAIHVLACDYGYANGEIRSEDGAVGGTANGCLDERSTTSAAAWTTTANANRSRRPTFAGGTVSLNAALFSTTLMASRLHADSSSSSCDEYSGSGVVDPLCYSSSSSSSSSLAYGFVLTSVGLFAFYPDARHAIAAAAAEKAEEEEKDGKKKEEKGCASAKLSSDAVLASPPTPCGWTRWRSTVVVTVSFTVAAYLPLENDAERMAFVCLWVGTCVVAPAMRWYLQRYKVVLTGPWDIAHIRGVG